MRHITIRAEHQQGVTLVELMVAMVLSLLVMGAATAMFVATSAHYRNQADISETEDSGRLAIELIARIVRQAQYENWDASRGNLINGAAYRAIHGVPLSPSIMGANNTRAANDRDATFGVNDGGGTVHGSDTLYVRYFGVSDPDDPTRADDTVIDCAGNGVPAPSSVDTADVGRGTSIFYVANDGAGQPNLYCKYKGKEGFAVSPLVRGVESFQVLYGIERGTPDSIPDTFLRADEIRTQDEWRSVVAVKVAMLVRGRNMASAAAPEQIYRLFGDGYASERDPGTVIRLTALPETHRGSLRKLYTATIFLRNAVDPPTSGQTI